MKLHDEVRNAKPSPKQEQTVTIKILPHQNATSKPLLLSWNLMVGLREALAQTHRPPDSAPQSTELMPPAPKPNFLRVTVDTGTVETILVTMVTTQ